jgi:hypothetical protein
MPKYRGGYMSPPYVTMCLVNNYIKIYGGLFVYVIYYPYLCNDTDDKG